MMNEDYTESREGKTAKEVVDSFCEEVGAPSRFDSLGRNVERVQKKEKGRNANWFLPLRPLRECPKSSCWQ